MQRLSHRFASFDNLTTGQSPLVLNFSAQHSRTQPDTVGSHTSLRLTRKLKNYHEELVLHTVQYTPRLFARKGKGSWEHLRQR